MWAAVPRLADCVVFIRYCPKVALVLQYYERLLRIRVRRYYSWSLTCTGIHTTCNVPDYVVGEYMYYWYMIQRPHIPGELSVGA